MWTNGRGGCYLHYMMTLSKRWRHAAEEGETRSMANKLNGFLLQSTSKTLPNLWISNHLETVFAHWNFKTSEFTWFCSTMRSSRVIIAPSKVTISKWTALACWKEFRSMDHILVRLSDNRLGLDTDMAVWIKHGKDSGSNRPVADIQRILMAYFWRRLGQKNISNMEYCYE